MSTNTSLQSEVVNELMKSIPSDIALISYSAMNIVKEFDHILKVLRTLEKTKPNSQQAADDLIFDTRKAFIKFIKYYQNDSLGD